MNLVDKIEKVIIYVLIAMLLIAVVLGTVALGRALGQTVIDPPFLIIEPHTLFESFGLFLVILIGLELLKLLKLHLQDHKVRPEVVIEVAIIAMCNKVVMLDVKGLHSETAIGLAALILALSVGYFVFTRLPAKDR